MLDTINEVEARILGSLVEKQLTTPEYYPLTLNALTAACNQTSNRDPVMQLDEATVASTIQELTRQSLVREVHRSDSRAKRWRQTLSESLKLHPAETAVLCVLMLRGAQTAGEIRTRSARLHQFPDLAHLDVTLKSLMDMAPPLVIELARRPGQKEARFAHLLAGEPQVDATEPMPNTRAAERDRVELLEQEVATLRGEQADLRARFDEFRQQFL